MDTEKPGRSDPARMPDKATVADALVWAGEIAAGKWPGVANTFTAMKLLTPEIERLRRAEEALRRRVAWLERDRVGGGVNVSDVPTSDVRAAFGWPELPVRLLERCAVCRGTGLALLDTVASEPVTGDQVVNPLQDCAGCGGRGVLADPLPSLDEVEAAATSLDVRDPLSSYHTGELVEVSDERVPLTRAVVREFRDGALLVQLFLFTDGENATGPWYWVTSSAEITQVSE